MMFRGRRSVRGVRVRQRPKGIQKLVVFLGVAVLIKQPISSHGHGFGFWMVLVQAWLDDVWCGFHTVNTQTLKLDEAFLPLQIFAASLMGSGALAAWCGGFAVGLGLYSIYNLVHLST